LVPSTVHTNDTAATITRLLELGVEPHVLGSSLLGIVAQRLVRKVCKQCAAPWTPPENELRQLNLDTATIQNATFMKGKGCSNCSNTGYRGRFGIFEIFVIDDDARKLIYEKVPSSVLRTRAREMGMRTLREEAINLVAQDITTVSEVIRSIYAL